MYLGVKAVITKSFARIHKANLVNFGILPLTFKNPADYDSIEPMWQLEIKNTIDNLKKHQPLIATSGGIRIELVYDLSDRDIEILIAGGSLNYVKQ